MSVYSRHPQPSRSPALAHRRNPEVCLFDRNLPWCLFRPIGKGVRKPFWPKQPGRSWIWLQQDPPAKPQRPELAPGSRKRSSSGFQLIAQPSQFPSPSRPTVSVVFELLQYIGIDDAIRFSFLLDGMTRIPKRGLGSVNAFMEEGPSRKLRGVVTFDSNWR